MRWTSQKLRWVGVGVLLASSALRAAPPDDGLGAIMPPPGSSVEKAPARPLRNFFRRDKNDGARLPDLGTTPVITPPAAKSNYNVIPAVPDNVVAPKQVLPAAQEKDSSAATPPPVSTKNAAVPPDQGRDADSSKVIERRLFPELADPAPTVEVTPEGFRYPIDPPLGFTGRSSILPREIQGDGDWVPMEDRWRAPFPSWNRYPDGKRFINDYPYDLGNIKNPYKQNVLKGDYPIIGQHTFLQLTASSISLVDTRQTPIGTTPFESTSRPRQEEFFGSPNQLVYNQFLVFSVDLNHGDSSFKPTDWRIKLTNFFNANTLNVDELAVVNPNVLKGVQRERTFYALQEYFIETKLADTSVYYDFVSARVGSQPFDNDFRGFLFVDTNRAFRLFGTNFSQRDEFNVAFFRQAEKDTNSLLNTMNDRGQNILLANYLRQDFIWPGYIIQGSCVYNNDPRSFKFDRNLTLVRPDPVGVFQQHSIDAVYFGFAGNGHIERYNITHQLYYVLGHDTLNPLANQSQEIRALFGAVELSYDRDWARFRTSYLYSSGDNNVNNTHATGFDSILDNPDFAGGQFSYWQRQAVKLFGVNLVNAGSLIPDLRSSRIQGQSNFVNPGLHLFNLGFDADLTPKIKSINNINLLWFDSTDPLKVFTFDGHMNSFIGTDISSGISYRPLLSNNVQIICGVSTLVPGSGFKALFDKFKETVDPLVAGFVQLNVNY